MARALRFQANLPIKFWGECVLTACHLINRTPSLLLKGKTPYELLFGTIPSYASFRVFGCLCYAHDLRHRGDKFASRSRKCIFVGYPFGKKGWKLFDLESGDYFVSRDVKFFENEFPFKAMVTPSPSHVAPIDDGACSEEDFVTTNDGHGHNNVEEDSRAEPTAPVTEDIDTNVEIIAINDEIRDGDEVVEEELGRGKRQKIPSRRYQDFITHTLRKEVKESRPSNISLHPTSTSSGIPYSITNFVSCNRFSGKHCVFLAAITLGREPTSFKEAMRDSGWRDAMSQEIRALEDNEMWVLEPLPPYSRKHLAANGSTKLSTSPMVLLNV